MNKASITIRVPKQADQQRFIEAMRLSRALHEPWVEPPQCADGFKAYLSKYRADNNISYLVMCGDVIAGVININEIVRGCFQSGYLGYYAVAAFSGQGIMHVGMNLVIQRAFSEHGLHRLEANIQPGNVESIRLVQCCGFEKEGFSKAYLKINNAWRDHERWAIRKD